MTALVYRFLESLPGGRFAHIGTEPTLNAQTWHRATSGACLLWLAAAFAAFLALAALSPGLLTSQNPVLTSPRDALLSPDAVHWLGTDENGRDVLARLIYGVRPSLLLGFASIAIAVTGGSVLGLLAALAGPATDQVVFRILDTLLAVPDILLTLLIITFWGAGASPEIVALGIAGVPRFARLTRSRALVVKGSGYVEAARAQGQSTTAIVLRHVLPNALGPVLPLATLGVGANIAVAAGLSFLGFGPPPPRRNGDRCCLPGVISCHWPGGSPPCQQFSWC